MTRKSLPNMPKHSAISMRVTDEVKEAAEKAAKARRLSVANYINQLLVQHLRQQGLLSDDSPIS